MVSILFSSARILGLIFVKHFQTAPKTLKAVKREDFHTFIKINSNEQASVEWGKKLEKEFR